MDVTAILNTLNQGGPTVLFLILAGLLWLQHLEVVVLKKNLEEVSTHFNTFQVAYANERVRKDDLDEIKELIKESNASTKVLIARIFERLDDHVSHCGKDCLASMQARADFRVAARPVHRAEAE